MLHDEQENEQKEKNEKGKGVYYHVYESTKILL